MAPKKYNKFVIVGTSGIGKSHLEQELSRLHNFVPIPKYTDRPLRKEEENSTSIYSLSKKKFKDREREFFFTLSYVDNNYGWLQSDLDKNIDNNLTVAIPVGDLPAFLETTSDFVPIMLMIDTHNIKLLRNRMEKRMGVENLENPKKTEAMKKIEARIKLIKEELPEYFKLEEYIARHNGKTFKVINDQTLYEDVIPYILSICK